jgi:hypothetical protein
MNDTLARRGAADEAAGTIIFLMPLIIVAFW